MTPLTLLIACASPPESEGAAASAVADSSASGCGTESSLAYGDIVEYTGEWIAYVDGGPLYCGPAPDGANACPVTMRVPSPGVRFNFFFTLLDVDGATLGSTGGSTVADEEAGDPCYGASGGFTLIVHDLRLEDGDEVRLVGEAVESRVSEDGEGELVPDGISHRVHVTGIVATSVR